MMREKKEINVQVGHQIRKAREAAGLTQERFAELIGISPQNVSCVERGLAGVSLTVLRRMCEILRVSSDLLLMGDLGDNDVETLAARLRQLPPEQFRVVQEVINRLLDAGLFPYTKRYLKHLNNHFSTIGICGMNECLLNFMGKNLIDPEARAFANEILLKMRERLSFYQETTGDLFNLEATPAESTSYRLAKHDKERYPDIITAGKSEGYDTNSTQLPVDFTEDIFEALDLQEDLQIKYTGGTVFHGFLGEAVTDVGACKNLVKAICSNYRIPYFTLSPVYSVCPVHGYLSGEHFNCPKCRDERKNEIIEEIKKLEREKASLQNNL